MINDCTGIILAGGDSSRMGQDKALLSFDGRPLIQSVLDRIQPLFPVTILSVREPLAEIDLPQVSDMESNGGPLTGLVSALAQINTPWAFVVGCDMPFVSPALIEQLAAHRFKPPSVPPCQGGSGFSSPDKGRPGGVCYQAVVPVVAGSLQPLAAFYSSSCVAAMRANLSLGDKSLLGALKQLHVCYVDEKELLSTDPQLRSFFDLDTPQDVVRARREAGAS